MKEKIIILVICLIIGTNIYGKHRSNYVILKKGETLWRIARRYHKSVSYLKKINNIKDISKLRVGQRIYLYKKRKYVRKRYIPRLNIKLKYPVRGKILSEFGEGKNLTQINGIDFKVSGKSYVKAAYSGVVKYTGKIRGYGNIIIVESSKRISMIYANLDKIFVKKNQRIFKQQNIGIVGRNSINKEYILHFELLSNGRPIDPKKYFD